jgi:hypothetical protein
MNRFAVLLLLFFVCSCKMSFVLTTPERMQNAITGSAFYKQAERMNWKQRDSLALIEIENGNIPDFLRTFSPVHVSAFDSASGKTIKAVVYVTADYLSIGSNNDWARIPLTPMTAQAIADRFQCFLPTQKLVDDIYKQAKIKLEPVWMFAYRDSTPTMYHHHLIIEGQRKQQVGLIAGIKKDVITTTRLHHTSQPNRVAIYGWHQLNGKPIQPVYTGHVNWYVDYSHGVRLVLKRMMVNGIMMDVDEVMKNPVMRRLITYETEEKLYRY